ncbi:putative deoxyribonuclease TATDN2 isoform X4 [Macaca fascicularis]|uniref:putative deoxyribonuclease TATDN2 isoform X4 n=1 Tax=Macaca fascicularis TaxID=9541 RepID=UPI003D1579C7
MASERGKVKHNWSSTSEGCPSKRSCLREPCDVAPSSQPAQRSASRSGGPGTPKRLKAQKEDDVACSRRLSWGSSRRRNNSSSSSSSPHFLGPGVGGTASKGCLIRSTGGFLSSGGSPLRPANASLEEMASLEEEACSLKVDSKDSSHNSTNSEFAAEAEGQNDTIEEPNKVQKRKRDRLRDQGSTMIYLKAIQGILGKSMPKRKGEAAIRAKPSTAERPSRGEGPARSEGPAKTAEGAARSVTVTTAQKEKDSTPEISVEEDKTVPEKSSFYDRRVVIDPQEEPSEEPLGDRRTVIDKCSPPLEFLDDADSHLEIQKALLHRQLPGHRAPTEVLSQHVCGLHGSADILLRLGGPGSPEADPTRENHRRNGCSLFPPSPGSQKPLPVCPPGPGLAYGPRDCQGQRSATLPHLGCLA